jgi:hypothetical protein
MLPFLFIFYWGHLFFTLNANPVHELSYVPDPCLAGTNAKKEDIDLNLSKAGSNLGITGDTLIPYTSREVYFPNKKANIRLAGTITVPDAPDKKFPAILLISGSGPDNRDEEAAGYKPFWVLANYFSSRGYVVLRYDDRGMGESEGSFFMADIYDLASDAKSGLKFLKKQRFVDTKKIGIIGHSEGGMIAAYLGARGRDVAWIVLMGSPGMSGENLLILQEEYILRASGFDGLNIQKTTAFRTKVFKLIKEEDDVNKLHARLRKLYTNIYPGIKKEKLDSLINPLLSPWLKSFIEFEPARYLSKVKIPVLALLAGNDLHVPPVENKLALEEALREAPSVHYEIKVIENVNHMFQTSSSGFIQEKKDEGQETISRVVLEKIHGWLIEQEI